MHWREGGLTRLIGTGLSVGTVRHRRKNECGHAKLAYGRPQHQTTGAAGCVTSSTKPSEREGNRCWDFDCWFA